MAPAARAAANAAQDAAKLAKAAEVVPTAPVLAAKTKASAKAKARAAERAKDARGGGSGRKSRKTAAAKAKESPRGGQVIATERGTSNFCVRLYEPGPQAERKGGISGIMQLEEYGNLVQGAPQTGQHRAEEQTASPPRGDRMKTLGSCFE